MHSSHILDVYLRIDTLKQTGIEELPSAKVTKSSAKIFHIPADRKNPARHCANREPKSETHEGMTSILDFRSPLSRYSERPLSSSRLRNFLKCLAESGFLSGMHRKITQ